MPIVPINHGESPLISRLHCRQLLPPLQNRRFQWLEVPLIEPPPGSATPADDASRGSALGVAGALFFAMGMYFLVVAPGTGETVNLRRLTMGETFTIVGAIFCGFAWRPKP